MAQKAPIYSEEDVVVNIELLNQLREAVNELEVKMRASAPIFKSKTKVGFGVNKAQRSIAADRIISIARAIKSLKGW